MRRHNGRKLLDYQVRRLRVMHKEGFPEKFLRKIFNIGRAPYYWVITYASYKEIR